MQIGVSPKVYAALMALRLVQERLLAVKKHIQLGRGTRNIVTIHSRLSESKTYRPQRAVVDMTSRDSRQQFRARQREAAKANAHQEYIERRRATGRRK